jgi:hypothetical protein
VYEAQEQFYNTIKPFQDAAVQSVKSFNEVATVVNDLVLDLTERNIQFGLKMYASGEKAMLDAVKTQQQFANNYVQLFAGLPFIPGKPAK